MVRSLLQPLPKSDLTVKLDALDWQILTVLQEDCTQSFNKIASKMHISSGTAYNRIKRLTAKGLLKGYAATVDLAKLGYNLTAVIMIQTEISHLDEVVKETAGDPHVVAIYTITGEYDAALVAKFKDRIGLTSFMKNLSALPYVKRTCTTMALMTVKEDFRIKLA